MRSVAASERTLCTFEILEIEFRNGDVRSTPETMGLNDGGTSFMVYWATRFTVKWFSKAEGKHLRQTLVTHSCQGGCLQWTGDSGDGKNS